MQFCAVLGVFRSPTAWPICAVLGSFGNCPNCTLSSDCVAKSRFWCFYQKADFSLAPAAPTPFASAPTAVFHLRTSRAKHHNSKAPIVGRLAKLSKTPTGRSTIIYRTVTDSRRFGQALPAGFLVLQAPGYAGRFTETAQKKT